MDDLVVIILTLIVAVVGTIGQIKKKKQSKGTNNENTSSPENMWDLLKNEAGVSPESVNPENSEQDFETEYKEEQVPYINEQGYVFDAKNEGGSITTDKVKAESEKKITKTHVKEKFSLRKAVIYSEILNRKYT